MNRQLINTIDEFQDFCRELGDVVALDFETTSLNYTEMEFVGFSLCSGDSACYVQNKKILPYLAALFSSKTWVMHLAKFDLQCCRKFCKEEPEKIFCTLIGSQLLNENLPSHSLKYLARHWLKVPEDEIKKYDEVSDDVTSNEFILYAQNDAIWAYLLYTGIAPKLKKEGLDYIAGIEMDFQRVLAEMEINGALIDVGKLKIFQAEVPKILEQLQIEMCEILNIEYGYSTNLFGEKELWTGVKFSSTEQLVKIAENLGFEIFERTKPSESYPKGQKSFDKNVKERLKNQHPFFNLIYRFGKLNHLNNNFIQSLEKFIDNDGRVRPSFNTVRTGRLSCSKPALQQLPNPKKEKLEFNHREIFIPVKGNVLVKADYSGQELRVLGEVTNESNMLNAFNNGYDLHLFTANRVFNLGLDGEDFIDGSEAHTETCSKYKQKRHQAKNGVNFPVIYGATAGRVAKDNKVSKKEAERWMNEFFKLYPGVKKSIDLIPKEINSNGFVRTLFGRKRRFPNYSGADKYGKAAQERQAFNMKIQGTSADIGKIAGVNLLKSLPKEAKIVLFVHDEFCVECPESMGEQVAAIMRDCMENAVALRVRMVVDVKIVRSFGE
jgi:DNA polymerase-1